MDRARTPGKTLTVFGGMVAHPAEIDRWDEAALDRYRDMLIGMRETNITPRVTLHHFSTPIWLAEMGVGRTGDRSII